MEAAFGEGDHHDGQGRDLQFRQLGGEQGIATVAGQALQPRGEGGLAGALQDD